MRIRVEDLALVDDLVDHLMRRVDAVASRVGADEIDVSLLGSYAREPLRKELERRLDEWRAGTHAAAAIVETAAVRTE